MWNRFSGLKKSTQIVILAAAAVSLSTIALTGGYYATRTDTIDNVDLYPEKLPVQAQLHDGETLRNVEFYEDAITPKRAVAYNNDGTQTEFHYRENGTLETAQTVRLSEGGARTILRSAVLADDGVTYKHDVEYFDDGVRIRKELILADNETQNRKYFFENGNVFEDQVIKLDRKGWKLATESEYRADKSLASTYVATENDGWDRKYFDETGVLTMSKSVHTWASFYTEVTYANGVVPIRTVEQKGSSTTVTLRRVDGTKSEVRVWYGPLVKAMMVVTYFDEQERKTFYQSYMSDDDGKPVLSSITIYDRNGDDARTVYYESDGEINETLYTFGDKSKWMRRLYRDDKTLKQEIDMEMGKGQVGTREFEAEDNIKFEIPEQYVVLQPYTTPEQVIEYHPDYNGH